MAMTYAMPPDTNEEENIIGGYLNKFQLVWLIIGAGTGAILTILFFKLIGPFSLFLCIPPMAVGGVFAFKKVENMTLFSYLRYKHKYNKMIKHFANFGNHKEICFIVQESEEEQG